MCVVLPSATKTLSNIVWCLHPSLNIWPDVPNWKCSVYPPPRPPNSQISYLFSWKSNSTCMYECGTPSWACFIIFLYPAKVPGKVERLTKEKNLQPPKVDPFVHPKAFLEGFGVTHMEIGGWESTKSQKSPPSHVWDRKIRFKCSTIFPFAFACRYDPNKA